MIKDIIAMNVAMEKFIEAAEKVHYINHLIELEEIQKLLISIIDYQEKDEIYDSPVIAALEAFEKHGFWGTNWEFGDKKDMKVSDK